MATIMTLHGIGPADHGRVMSLEEFMEAEVEERYRYELARGVVEVKDFPDESHRQVVSNLYKSLADYRSRRPGTIRWFGGTGQLRLWLPGRISSRTPDLGVVLEGTPKDIRGKRPPALVAEIVSRHSLERDYDVKREEYLAYGLHEYWIVDTLKRQVIVLTRLGDSWHELMFRGAHVIGSLVLRGFATTVADLWIDVEDDQPDTEMANEVS